MSRSEVRADTERAHWPVGSVAEIIGVPVDALHSYRVRFSDGGEASLWRRLQVGQIRGPSCRVALRVAKCPLYFRFFPVWVAFTERQRSAERCARNEEAA